jgi:anoctamin-10
MGIRGNQHLISVPANKIARYFGEKIAFYFAFLSFYVKYLMILAPVGVFIFMIQVTTEKTPLEKIGNFVYFVFLILWSTSLIHQWRVKEQQYSTIWGMKTLDDDETQRPSFFGFPRRSPIDDDPHELFYSRAKRNFKFAFGFFVSAIIIAIVITIVYLIYFEKTELAAKYKGEWFAPYISTVAGKMLRI